MSLVLEPSFLEKNISLTLFDADLNQTLDAFAFSLGASWRVESNIYYIAIKKGQERIKAVPRGNIDASALNSFGGKASIVNDKLVLRGTAQQLSDMEEVINKIRDVEVLRLRVVAIDYDTNFIDSTNQWISDLVATGQISATTSNQFLNFGFDFTSILRFVNYFSSSSVRSDILVTIPSGGSSKLNIGRVLERELFTAVADGQGQSQFRSKIDRIPVGFSLDITGNYFNDKWSLNLTLTDVSRTAGTVDSLETRSEFTGNVIINSQSKVTEIAKVSRTQISEEKNKFILFNSLRKKSKTKNVRYISILVQPVDSEGKPLNATSHSLRIPSR